MKTLSPSLLLLWASLTSAASAFSMLYLGPESSHSLQPLHIHSQPSTEQLADIVCRLNGLPPLLIEDQVNMPQLDILLGKHSPIVVEVKDQGRLSLVLFNKMGNYTFRNS